jgi:hypothetical protein
MMNSDERMMAYLSFKSFEATGGPNTFAASFAPNAQPKNRDGMRKMNKPKPPGKRFHNPEKDLLSGL